MKSDCLARTAQLGYPREAFRLCATEVLEVETAEEEAEESLDVIWGRDNAAQAMAANFK